MTESAKPRAIGLNHIALEVGDIDEALAFYGRLFEFKLRGKNDKMAFIDLGDRFIALQKGRKPPTTVVILVWLWTIRRPFVDLLNQPASHKSKGPFLDFRDPWGNRIEIVDYASIQFTKAPNVLRGMGLDHLMPPAAAGNFSSRLKVNHRASLCATAWSASAYWRCNEQSGALSARAGVVCRQDHGVDADSRERQRANLPFLSDLRLHRVLGEFSMTRHTRHKLREKAPTHTRRSRGNLCAGA